MLESIKEERFICSLKKGDFMKVIEERKRKEENETEETPAADFFMGILLMVLSAGICYASWSWPRPTGMSSAPGLLPFFVAFSLFFMSLGVFVSSLKNRGFQKLIHYFNSGDFRKSLTGEDTKLLRFAFATVLIYTIVLLNLLPFEGATFIYTAGSLHLFWREKIYKVLILAASATVSYSIIFKFFFKLSLPGTGM
ncbi:MAG: hypothetical protein A3K30_00545 [Deltaproteobacteria bacterium RBG_13_51_10]|nr:MAG: hypothetical protein A3K30_00545 [Deltaproteobacteria bacterium RBG_13_51_10]